MQPDLDRSAAAMVAGTQKAIAAAVGPLLKRIEALESRPLPERGEKGDRGQPGDPGKDGIDLADALIDRDGVLVLTLSSGEHRRLGVVQGKDGEPGPRGEKGDPGADGKDGRDGIDAVLDDEAGASLMAAALADELRGISVEMPDPPTVPIASANKQQPVNVNIQNHIPRQRKERTVVTRHDESGRIAEFERHYED